MSYGNAAHWIRDKLTSVWTGRSEPLVWEGVGFEPTYGTPYVRASLNTMVSRIAEFGVAPTYRHPGLLVCEIRTPVGEGPGEAIDLADVLIAGFRAVGGTESGTVVHFSAPYSVTQGELGDGWYKVDVLAPFWWDD